MTNDWENFEDYDQICERVEFAYPELKTTWRKINIINFPSSLSYDIVELR